MAETPLLPSAADLAAEAPGKPKEEPKTLPERALSAIKKGHASQHKPAEQQQLSVGWQGTVCWAGFIVLWYLLLQRTLASVVQTDPAVRTELFDNVPLWLYHYSEAAFATSTVLSLINMVFEDTADKQQLALLSVVIKGLSWHSDHLITSGRGVIKRDRYGAIFLPSRYVQWSCSTPTMIFTISRISAMSAREVAFTMLADWLMVVNGWAASETPFLLAALHLAFCFACFGFVLRKLWRMLQDALKAADTHHSRVCLWFTLGSTVVVWNGFWVAWTIQHLGSHRLMILGEVMTMACNFSAKVVFSTSIMYNNFVTLAERRRAAQAAKEHADRLQAVHDLTAAVKSRDQFLEVVGHELRTPLNAVLQLSSALALGAAGALTVQAREWLATIKASAGHLLGVVNDILTFRASQATTLQLNQELVSVGDVVDEVMRQLLPSAGPTIVLEKVIHARLPPVVADRRRLALALSSLVANAIKFMDKPTGSVTVKAYPDRGARHVIIKVVDNGPGLTPTQLAQLSNPIIAQVDAANRRAGGLGLGLPITHQLVAAHGGVVRISSPGVGKGATVLLRIPVLQAVTHPALRHDFSVAYTSLGYDLDQLLSPELAAAESRACPTFNLPNNATTSPTSSAASITNSTGLSAAAGLSSPHLGMGAYNPAMFQPSALMPSGHFASAAAPLPSHVSVASTQSSFDLGGSIAQAHTYRWHPGLVASATGGGSLAANVQQQQAQQALAQAAPNQGTATPSAYVDRPSEDSLAAWEAYADRMGYTLPTQNSEPSNGQQQQQQQQDGGALSLAPPSLFSTGEFSMQGDRLSTASAVVSAKGLPGQAVALMSSLYAKPDAAGSGGMLSSLSKGGLRRPRSGVARSNRDSIEECDEEGQEPEEPVGSKLAPNISSGSSRLMQLGGGRDSVEVVHTPLNTVGSNVMGRTSDVSRGSAGDCATDALMTAAAHASQVVNVAAQRLQTTVAELEAVSDAALAADAAAEAAARRALKVATATSSAAQLDDAAVGAQQARAPTEWEEYVHSGPASDITHRQDAPEVVADNVRLSMQYNQMLAAANAQNVPIEPQWETWVARIPEHHKAAVQQKGA